MENKFYKKIIEIFDVLSDMDKNVLSALQERSIDKADELALQCASINKQINLILKNYYPEIRNMDKKLEIKSKMKFYYDLINNLTDFIRHVENFEKIDDRYFDEFLKFLLNKEFLISGKYTRISKRELASFYDQKSRDALESILTQKIEAMNRNYFTMGSLEEEIKKIAKMAGAVGMRINKASDTLKEEFKQVQSVIEFIVSPIEDCVKREKVNKEIIEFLNSKNYATILLDDNILTDANLLSDSKK
ncbi:MAG: hypothetical protein ACFFAS_16215 [Promethearchaeota archaeon]